MLFKTLKALILKKRTDGLEEKIDIFFAADKITLEQYNELKGLLEGKEGS